MFRPLWGEKTIGKHSPKGWTESERQAAGITASTGG